MKKIGIVVAVLVLAAPAFAYSVVITATPATWTPHPNTGWISINYSSDANISAFGLDIMVDAGVIDEVNVPLEGESTSSAKGFGIFLDKINGIDINSAGVVQSWGSPVADACAAGALGGLGTTGITIEMAALYEDGNQPPLTGKLLDIHIGGVSACNLDIDVNPTRCGKTAGDANAGVVMEDGNSVVPTLSSFPTAVTGIVCLRETDIGYTTWVLFGRPDCWCFRKQCMGDGNGSKEFMKPVMLKDLGIFKAGYNKTTNALKTITGPDGDKAICADFNHDKEFMKRVMLGDLAIFKAHYNKSNASVRQCDPNVAENYWTN